MHRQIKSWHKKTKKIPQFAIFMPPTFFYFPYLFPGSILLPPVIGVDVPVYSGKE